MKEGDFMFLICCMVIALTPVMLGLYGVFLVLKIFFLSALTGIGYVGSCSALLIMQLFKKK